MATLDLNSTFSQFALVDKMGTKVTYIMPEQQFKSNCAVLLLFFAFASANYMSENRLFFFLNLDFYMKKLLEYCHSFPTANIRKCNLGERYILVAINPLRFCKCVLLQHNLNWVKNSHCVSGITIDILRASFHAILIKSIK